MSYTRIYELYQIGKTSLSLIMLLFCILPSYLFLSSTVHARFIPASVDQVLELDPFVEHVEIINEKVLGKDSFIIKRNDLTLNDLQNIILSYDPKNNELYSYYMTNGLLERYSLDGDTISILSMDTLYNQGEVFSAYMMILPEERTISMWEAAIGHVFQYSLDTNTLERVDRSRVRDFMFGAGTVYTDSLGIFAFGGYGLWEHKNFLLQYSFDLKEWIKVDTKGDIPSKSGVNYMLRYPDKQTLLYSNNGGISSRFRAKGLHQINMYTYDLTTKTWTKQARHIFSDDVNLSGISFRHQKAFSIDTLKSLAHLRDRLFIDLQTFEILELRREYVPNINAITAFYNEGKQEWTLVGRKSTMDARNLWIIPIQLSRDMLRPLKSMSMIEYVIFYETPLLLGALILVIGLIVGLKKVSRYRRKNFPSDQVYLDITDDHLVVQKNGETVLMNDEYIEKIWNIIYRQKNKNEPEMMMIDFDEELFTVSNSTSYRSKMKAKLFEEVNLGLQSFVIRAKRSSLDKRYKVIEINLSIIQTP